MTDAEKVRWAVEHGEFVGDVGTLGPLLVAAIKAARDETDAACRMFSRYTWVGRLDMPREFHEARGRRMAGLAGRAAGVPAGGGGAVDHPISNGDAS